MQKILLAIFILIFSSKLISATYYDRLIARGSINYWPKLLHFDQNYFLPSGSRIDYKRFFLHEDGHKDLEKELDATIRAFISGKPLIGEKKLHPQCAFPERRRYLVEAKIEKIKEVVCPGFNKWAERLSPQSLSLVFLSPSVKSPIDYLGETVLKLRTRSGKAYAIYFKLVKKSKDYYVLGPFKNLFGFNQLRINIVPYEEFFRSKKNFTRIDQYEYDLLLNYPEMERLINHLWEINNLDLFNYYLMNENTTYFLASLLSIVKDEWDFLKGNQLYYTPRDLIRQIYPLEDSVHSVYYTPSLKKQIDASYNGLSSKEKSLYQEVDKENIELRLVTNPKVLDALILKGKFEKEREFFNKKVKNRRDELKGESKKIDYRRENAPHKAHDTALLSFSSVLEEDHSAVMMGYSPFYHGTYSKNEGFENGSGIDIFHFKLVYDFKVKKVKVPEFTFIEYDSRYLITHYDFGLSQKFALKKDYVEDIDLAFKSRIRGYYGVGLTYNFIGLLSFYSGLEFQRSTYTKKHFRLGPWIEWNLLFNAFNQGRIIFRQKLFCSVLENMSGGYYLENQMIISIPTSTNNSLYFSAQGITKAGSLDLAQYKFSLGFAKQF